MEYAIKNNEISMTVSTRGGEPTSIKSADGADYLWVGSNDYWSGNAPHLFPLIGRLFEERYLYKGESYSISIHGFLKDSEMRLVESGSDFLTLQMDSSDETFKQYPFRFELRILYRLVKNAVKITFFVKNTDEKEMLFAIGGHPGFMVPLEKGLSFEDYYLEFSEKAEPKRAEPRASNLLNGNYLDYPLKDGTKIELDHRLFDNDAIVLKDMARSVTLKSDKGSRAVRVDYPDFKYIGFWHTVKRDAPFVCIEPWTALQGYENTVLDLETNQDLIALKQGEEYQNEWTITIIS